MSRAQNKELQSHVKPSNILLLCGRQLLLCCFFQATVFLMNCVTMFLWWFQTFVFQQYKRKICGENEHSMVPKGLITFAHILFLSTSSMKKQPNKGFSMFSFCPALIQKSQSPNLNIKNKNCPTPISIIRYHWKISHRAGLNVQLCLVSHTYKSSF